MTYRTTEAADRDIADIYVSGISLFGERQAERYQDGIFETFGLLSEHPRLARERPEFTPPIRTYPYGSHLIVYVVTNDTVLIVRVLPGRSDWEQWLS